MIAQESVEMAKLLREKLNSELGIDLDKLSQEQIDWLLTLIETHKDEVRDKV